MTTSNFISKHFLGVSAGVCVFLLSGCSALNSFEQTSTIEERKSAYPTLRGPNPTLAQHSQGVEPGQFEASNVEPVRTYQGRIFKGRPIESGLQDTLVSSDKLVLNFENASIEQAATLILGDFLSVPYEIHPTVTGTINLKSADSLDGAAALGALETVLRQNNAALVVDAGLYRIVPSTLALGYAAAPQIGTGRPVQPGYAVQIVPLKFVAATEMAEILKPLSTDGSVIRIDKERNLLMLAGTGREIQLWLQTIQTFDIDWFEGKSVGVFPLQRVSASQVISELQAIFSNEKATAATGESPIKFLAIDRTNSVMAITRAVDLLEKVRTWTQRLDNDSGASRRLRVYQMKNAKAADVAPLLQEIFNVPSHSTNQAASIVSPGVTPATKERAEGVVAVSTATGRPSSKGGSSSTRASRGTSSGDALRIIPDEGANTLLIMATQDEYRRMSEALRQLDVAPLQVLVEATIVEVTITDDLRYGVQYFLEGTLAQEPAVGTLSNAATNAILPTFPGASLVLGEPSKIVLDALEGITELNVISSPNLMVLDNQTARLVVGDQIPVTVQNVTNGFTSTQNDPVLFNSIEFRDTGVIFEVTPHISSDGSVTLDILQEVSNVSRTSSQTLTPTISQRKIESSVVAQSGQTIVLGGLFSDNEARLRSGIPVLSRAPLFGGLFSTTSKNETRKELVVLIQPRILRNEAEAIAITREFQDRVTGLKLSAEQVAPTMRDKENLIFEPVRKEDEEFIAQVNENAVEEATIDPFQLHVKKTVQPVTLAKAPVLESVLPGKKKIEHLFVQLGAFDNASDAKRAMEEMQSLEKNLTNAPFSTRKDDKTWRLLAGPFVADSAHKLCESLSRPCAVVGG